MNVADSYLHWISEVSFSKLNEFSQIQNIKQRASCLILDFVYCYFADFNTSKCSHQFIDLYYRHIKTTFSFLKYFAFFSVTSEIFGLMNEKIRLYCFAAKNIIIFCFEFRDDLQFWRIYVYYFCWTSLQFYQFFMKGWRTRTKWCRNYYWFWSPKLITSEVGFLARIVCNYIDLNLSLKIAHFRFYSELKYMRDSIISQNLFL